MSLFVYPTVREPDSPKTTQSTTAVNTDFGGNEAVLEYIPIRFLENRIGTLSRTCVPHDLARLAQHRENMEKWRETSSWNKLHVEQVNASRTVQVCVRACEGVCACVHACMCEEGRASLATECPRTLHHTYVHTYIRNTYIHT